MLPPDDVCGARTTAGRGSPVQRPGIATRVAGQGLAWFAVVVNRVRLGRGRVIRRAGGRGRLAGRRLTWMLGVLGVLVIGCAYKPGSYAAPARAFDGQRTTVGCLDVAIDRQTDLGSSAVIGYTFGNRCDRPAVVDLAWVSVIGRTADGAEVALVPYDPKGELRALRLDGRSAGAEAIAYPAPEALGQVCVDVASLAQQTPAQWICFGNREPVAMVTR